MTEWTNEGKFNGIRSHDLYPRKGSAVWDPRRMEAGLNSNGVVHSVFYQDEEVLVKWYDKKDKYTLMGFSDFYGKWTDKYTGGYWLDDSTAPGR